MTELSIKDIVKDNRVYFSHLRKEYAYYKIEIGHLTVGKTWIMGDRPMDWRIFPVELADLGDATILAEDKAITFMRYIRKAIDNGTFVKA